jgi:hypothetical protein
VAWILPPSGGKRQGRVRAPSAAGGTGCMASGLKTFNPYFDHQKKASKDHLAGFIIRIL